MEPPRAVYAGSFDPITLGHLDVITRARRLVGELIVAVGDNPRKRCLFPLDERMAMIAEALPDPLEVVSFGGLLVDFARDRGCGVIVRGLRNPSDFAFEQQVGLTNAALRPELETVFLLARPPHQITSASMVREIAAYGGDASAFVPACVAPRLRARFAEPA